MVCACLPLCRSGGVQLSLCARTRAHLLTRIMFATHTHMHMHTHTHTHTHTHIQTHVWLLLCCCAAERCPKDLGSSLFIEKVATCKCMRSQHGIRGGNRAICATINRGLHCVYGGVFKKQSSCDGHLRAVCEIHKSLNQKH